MKKSFYITMILVFSFLWGCTVPAPAPVVSRSVDMEKKPAEAYYIKRDSLVDGSFYIVEKGETLYGIALAFGQNWRDIAAWNDLNDPNRIKQGQRLRVLPLNRSKSAVPIPLRATTVKPPDNRVEIEQNTGKDEQLVGENENLSENLALEDEEPITRALGWAWPANGQVIEKFTDSNSKGISIAGLAGEDIYAVSDGKVVYSGNGLRGYGNLIIVKHAGEFITAYAHNKSIFVKEGEDVSKGQKIAEMGMSETNRPKLLFEVRKGGKPLDPLKYLPQR
jgi:lipoprotein NlpD